MTRVRLTKDEMGLVMGFIDQIRRPELLQGLNRQQSLLVGTLRSAPGRIISREFIAAACNLDVADVKRTIKAVRDARPDLGKHIATIAGVGYRWRQVLP